MGTKFLNHLLDCFFLTNFKTIERSLQAKYSYLNNININLLNSGSFLEPFTQASWQISAIVFFYKKEKGNHSFSFVVSTSPCNFFMFLNGCQLVRCDKIQLKFQRNDEKLMKRLYIRQLYK